MRQVSEKGRRGLPAPGSAPLLSRGLNSSPRIQQLTVGDSECQRTCRWHAHITTFPAGTQAWLIWRGFCTWLTHSVAGLPGEVMQTREPERGLF